MSYFTHVNGKYMEIKDIDEVLENLKYLYDDQQYRINALQEANKKLTDENWQDEKLQEMKTTLEQVQTDARRGFSISEDEEKRIFEWQRKHIEEAHGGNSYAGAIGGRFQYIFTPTGIGTFGTCKYSCGATFEFANEF